MKRVYLISFRQGVPLLMEEGDRRPGEGKAESPISRTLSRFSGLHHSSTSSKAFSI